ncbi:MAG: hypothetical protein LBH66_01925 [Oscillospiraceae bacterium]|jgi:hypothetical protein|nr:hypothetical protein [Oscillospiraceae bacterium]
MNALHTATNNVRTFYGLINMRWVDPTIAHKTPIRDWLLHIAELRAGMEGVVYLINAFDAEDAFDVPIPQWIDNSTGFPQADMVNQIAITIQFL